MPRCSAANAGSEYRLRQHFATKSLAGSPRLVRRSERDRLRRQAGVCLLHSERPCLGVGLDVNGGQL